MIKIENTIGEYDSKKNLFEECKSKIENLIVHILKHHKIKVHNISSRVKERDSLRNKLQNKIKNYKELSDITDLIGIRIITFFEEDVDRVAKIIEEEFEIDIDNSIDKREKEYDRFGYSSIHYIIKLSKERKDLPEYLEIGGLKVELQIRSILQHAWAEIEHDIGYKNKDAIPNNVKRNFSRVSALLETADLEFNKLNKSIIEYKIELPNRVTNEPTSVLIDKNSLEAFMNQSDVLRRIDKKIASKLKCNLLAIDSEYDVILYPTLLKYVGINNIKQLENELIKNENEIVKFAYNFNTIDSTPLGGAFDYGISIFYLGYLLAIKKNDEKLLTEYLNTFITKADVQPLIENLKKASRNIL